MPQIDDEVNLMMLEEPERTWGLDVEDIEAITAIQLRGETEYGSCYYCRKKMFRITDYSGRTPEWRHSSTGYPQSYTPQPHDARDQSPIPEHDHEWIMVTGYSTCKVIGCGARKLPVTPKIPRGIFMPSIKDQQMAAARARGLAAGTDSQKKESSKLREAKPTKGKSKS